MYELLSLIVFGLVVGALHFSIPLAYFTILRRFVSKPWALKVDEGYKPQVAVIVPTYNEAEFIIGRLENLVAQDYPAEGVVIIVIDSGSTDGTAVIVEEWFRKKGNVNGKLIRELTRSGKFNAVNRALEAVPSTCAAVVLTDADACWEPRALSRVISFLADPNVGSVTGSMFYKDDRGLASEETYRSYYNSVRVAESKVHSTPIHNGPMLAIRTELLRKIGFPNFPGSDDSAFGSLIALAGYRAIQVDGAAVSEYVRGNRLRRRVRRATCLLLNFHNTKRYAKKMNLYVPSKFDSIWRIEWWLCAVNPWLLFASAFLLVGAAFYESTAAAALLVANAILLLTRPYRTWVLQQLYLVLGTFRSLSTKEEVWSR